MSYYKNETSKACDNCSQFHEISTFSFYNKKEVDALLAQGGLIQDFGEIMTNLIDNNLKTQAKNPLDAINELKEEVDKKQDHHPNLDLLSAKTQQEVNDLIILASLLK